MVGRITIYTLPNCVQCETTKRYLSKHLIEYSVVALEADMAAYEKIKQLGYTQAPIVIVEGGRAWSGFRKDELDKVILDNATSNNN